jgi:hypothetical protein
LRLGLALWLWYRLGLVWRTHGLSLGEHVLDDTLLALGCIVCRRGCSLRSLPLTRPASNLNRTQVLREGCVVLRLFKALLKKLIGERLDQFLFFHNVSCHD